MKTSVAGPSYGQRIARGGQTTKWSWALAALPFLGAPLPVLAETAVPAGMVRYDHPVYRHGHLVLWHGAWRDGKKGDS